MHWKDWYWIWNSNTLATWCEQLTHLKRPWCWERLKVGEEGDDRRWDGWTASLTRWRWVWVNTGSWLWTGRPGVLQSIGLQRVRHDCATELNCHCFHCFPIYLSLVIGPAAMILVFWMLSFKPPFCTLLFHFHQETLWFLSLSAVSVVSSAYLRLLIFLPAIVIQPCASSSPAFLRMYSAQKLNKQGDNIQPWCTPFPIWNHYVVPCPLLTVASWPAYRFLRRQVRWSGIPISFRIFHSLLSSTQSKALA